MDFLNDIEKMNDFFILNRDEFLESYSYLSEEDYQQTLDKLWEESADVPIDENENIDIDWRFWEKGTFREEIWHWFDEREINGIGNKYF